MSELDLPGIEKGKRSERVEHGIRINVATGIYKRGEIEPCSEHKARWVTSPEAYDELPYAGYPRDHVEHVTRTVVTYTAPWEAIA